MIAGSDRKTVRRRIETRPSTRTSVITRGIISIGCLRMFRSAKVVKAVDAVSSPLSAPYVASVTMQINIGEEAISVKFRAL